MTLAAGTPIGKYVVKRKLAEGGMAEIFLCTSVGAEGFEKEVVIKRIRPFLASDPKFVEMFINEAQLASRLNHPNIVQIFDFDKHEDTYYLAMEYVHGGSLWELRRRCKELMQPLPVTLVAHIGAEVARGLHHAHRLASKGKILGIVHRDVTPHNVLLSFDGAVKLTDFGIAKADTTGTAPGVLKGKFAYMSPEQARGDAVDARTDVFALGIVLWEMLTGGRLFEADNEIAVLRAVQSSQIPPPARINPDVPEELSARILKALERDVAGRFQTAQELERELRQFVIDHTERFEDTDVGGFIRKLFPEEATNVRGMSISVVSIVPEAPAAEPPREKTAVQRSQGSLPPRPAQVDAKTNVLSRGGPKTAHLASGKPALAAAPKGPPTDPSLAAHADTSVRPTTQDRAMRPAAPSALSAAAEQGSAPQSRIEDPDDSSEDSPQDPTQVIRAPASPSEGLSRGDDPKRAASDASRRAGADRSPELKRAAGDLSPSAETDRSPDLRAAPQAAAFIAPPEPAQPAVPARSDVAKVSSEPLASTQGPQSPQPPPRRPPEPARGAPSTDRPTPSRSRAPIVIGALVLVSVGVAIAVGVNSARSSNTPPNGIAADVGSNDPSGRVDNPPVAQAPLAVVVPVFDAGEGEVTAEPRVDAGARLAVVPAVADAGAVVVARPVVVKRKGTLRVAVSPWAKVVIDGVVRGEVQSPRQFPLEVGEHRVRLEHPRGNRERKVLIQAGQTFTLTVNMLAEDSR